MTASVVELDRDAGPPLSRHGLLAGALIAAAGLMGFGLILWIAANWEGLGRFGRFGLVGAAVVASGLSAIAWPSLRVPSLLAGFCAAGGMLALIGQTYQTGADPWQLFALWAALTLPWALAARSDAVWTAWVIVALTAIGLFQHASGAVDALMRNLPGVPNDLTSTGSVIVIVLGTWAIALGLSAVLAPVSPVGPWLGHRRSAFRVAALLAFLNIATLAVMAACAWPTAKADIIVLGLVVHGAALAALAASKPRDTLLMAGAALAIDVVAIAAMARMMLPERGGPSAAHLFLIGIFAAAIVAGSVVGLMRLAGRNGHDDATALQPAPDRHAVPPTGARPWPAVVLSGIGALIAALPLIAAVAILLGRTLERGASAYLIGAAAAGAGIALLRQSKGLFVEQLAAIAFTVGLLLLGYGVLRDLPPVLAWFLIATGAAAVGLWLDKPWAAALLGAVAAVGFALAVGHIIGGTRFRISPPAMAIAWMLLAGVWAGIVTAARDGRLWLEPLRNFSAGEAMLIGSAAAVLLGLTFLAGPSFLLGASLGSGAGIGTATGVLSALDLTARVVGLAMAATGAALLWRQIEVMRSAIGAAVIAVLIGLTWFSPLLGAVALVLAMALTTGRRAVVMAAAIAALWIAGSFYYDLSLTLTAKAGILGAAGALLGGIALATGARPELPGEARVAGSPAIAPGLARGLAAVGLIAVTAVSMQAIHAKEALIRDGRPVFVELAPVDPRSLMQGDYMALRFVLPDAALRHQPMRGERPLAIGRIDAGGVVRLARIGNAATPIAADEIAIKLTHKNGRWIVVTDAWFFAEGNAKKWEAARFGELRVLPDGSALLVGMADKERRRIE